MVKLNPLQKWDFLYRKGKHLSVWPWSDLVSYVLRNADAKKKNLQILKLGCGAGANIPFFLSLEANYYGIDGSSYIINKLKKQFPELKNKLIQSDFTKIIPFKQKFDLIVDRASLTHNTTETIKNCIKLIHSKLKTNGIYIGIDWFSTTHSDFKMGKQLKNDVYSRTGYSTGQFADIETVHFSDKDHLLNLFKDFKIKKLELKTIKREIPKDKYVFASWNLLAIRK